MRKLVIDCLPVIGKKREKTEVEIENFLNEKYKYYRTSIGIWFITAYNACILEPGLIKSNIIKNS